MAHCHVKWGVQNSGTHSRVNVVINVTKESWLLFVEDCNDGWWEIKEAMVRFVGRLKGVYGRILSASNLAVMPRY